MSNIKIAELPVNGDKNAVRQKLQAAMDLGLDEVFIIGVKDNNIRTIWSGYSGIERRIGALEILKTDLLLGAQQGEG